MTAAGQPGATAPAAKILGAATLENRFLLSSVAFLRAKQLLSGARPRLEPERHKSTQLALLEVLADTVSWSVEDPKLATKAAAATP
jgi:DNA-directed RNA polymerase subunit K/omega